MPPADPHPTLIGPGRDLTPEEMQEFRERLARFKSGPVRWIHPDGKARRRLPLPWHARACLRTQGAVDGIGIRLCAHGHRNAALWLWKALGMIRS